MKLSKAKCVYIFHNKLLGQIKIGISSNVKSRLGSIICSSGMEVDLYHSTKPILNYLEVENNIHEYFKNKRAIGEWFKIEPEIALEYIVSINHKFEVDPIYLEFEKNNNYNQIARHFGVSRPAIKKRLNKFQETKKNIIKSYGENRVESIPTRSNYIGNNIYEKEGLYYLQKWIKGVGFIILKFSCLKEAESYKIKKIIHSKNGF